MKEFNLGCKSMRDGVIVASVFLAAALSLMLAARFLVPQIAVLQMLVQAFGILVLLFVPVILVTSWLRHVTHRPVGPISGGHLSSGH